jgi:hypothetical protein
MDIRDIGHQLGVPGILEGAVQREDGRLRVTVQLVDTTDGCHLWSRRFDRPASDVFSVQDEIAQAVFAGLSASLPGGGEEETACPGPRRRARLPRTRAGRAQRVRVPLGALGRACASRGVLDLRRVDSSNGGREGRRRSGR